MKIEDAKLMEYVGAVRRHMQTYMELVVDDDVMMALLLEAYQGQHRDDQPKSFVGLLAATYQLMARKEGESR